MTVETDDLVLLLDIAERYGTRYRFWSPEGQERYEHARRLADAGLLRSVTLLNSRSPYPSYALLAAGWDALRQAIRDMEGG